MVSVVSGFCTLSLSLVFTIVRFMSVFSFVYSQTVREKDRHRQSDEERLRVIRVMGDFCGWTYRHSVDVV